MVNENWPSIYFISQLPGNDDKWGIYNTLHIFTFGIRAGPKEHRLDIESEDPKRGAAVIDILRGEGQHLPDTTDNHHCSFRPGGRENVKM